MGLDPAMVVHAKGIGPDFTFFIVYGRVSHLVDMSAVTVAEREYPLLTAQEVNLRIRSALGRKFVVVGACIGTDAHTVGIDAILNVKGHAGEKGLEYYREIRVVNMGAQVGVPDLVARARAERADAVLVSQVVTQRDAHLSNAREMAAAFRDAYPGGGRPVLVVGGPRFDPAAAAALGVDAIFGRGTTPREVASYLAATARPRRRPMSSAADPRLGLSVTHRRYVSYGDAHYGGNLVDGAYALALFGDVATEVCIRLDGDEGLFAVLLRRAVPRAGAGGRRHRGHGRGHRRGAAQPGADVRGQRGLPGRPGAGALGRGGARGAAGRGHRHRDRRCPRAQARLRYVTDSAAFRPR